MLPTLCSTSSALMAESQISALCKSHFLFNTYFVETNKLTYHGPFKD